MLFDYRAVMKPEQFSNDRPRLPYGVSELEHLSSPVKQRWRELCSKLDQDAAQEESSEKLDVGSSES